MTATTPSLGLQNFYSTTLASNITTTDTVIYLNGTLPTPSEGYLVLNLGLAGVEVIHYTSKGANYVQCTSVADGRGQDGTTASAHTSGASVKMTVNAGYWTALQNGTAFSIGAVGNQAFASGWTPILSTPNPVPNTVTYNGNRSYNLVFTSTDLTGIVSVGMPLKFTRTVTAPTQCTSLNGTSQYYSKSSPAAMTFTDDFTVSAWIKLSSYAAGTVASRYNGTSGWALQVLATGQVQLTGYNGGAGNNSLVLSYQSLPLNKWVHVAAQLDMSAFTATTTTSYVMLDGVDAPASVSRGGTSPTALVQAGNLEVGTANAGTFFPGKLAQVAIFNAKVTQATIQGYISQGLAGTETSLISAYNFNNSINDINANANNLTANGSAVATNADSPFAQNSSATPTGTTDYGIIMAVSFSTNTTVTVQVPEGCTIPTSGGVSALSYAVAGTPLGFVRDVVRWTIEMWSIASETVGVAAINNWYVATGAKINLPIGPWRELGYQGTVSQESTVAGARTGFVTLASTTPSAIVAGVVPANMRLMTRLYDGGASSSVSERAASVRMPVSVAVATTYALYGAIDAASGSEVWKIRADQGPLVIFAIPAGV